MKKYIKNKLYNTETAKLIAEWDNGIYGDIDSCSETLYRKITGEYFLHGIGGARTIYAKTTGNNNWCGSEDIIPLTYEAAEKWAAEKLSTEDYNNIFGEITEDKDKTTMCISIKKSKAEALKRKASESGKPISSVIEDMIND